MAGKNEPEDLKTPKNRRSYSLDDWGYDMYPERRGDYNPKLTEIVLGEGREFEDRLNCEMKVYDCITKSKLVRLMMGALKSSGCEIDIRRHISCEVCSPRVTGGYDPVLNQIVVCQNRATSKGLIQAVLTHEMIHMFDYCRHKLDFRNKQHLACTEIRAANLTHCSFISAMIQGDVSPHNIKEKHQNCVKTKAAFSVMAVQPMTEEEARAVVDSVFPQCYADLEPIGRRIKAGKLSDIDRAYSEGFLYGYV